MLDVPSPKVQSRCPPATRSPPSLTSARSVPSRGARPPRPLAARAPYIAWRLLSTSACGSRAGTAHAGASEAGAAWPLIHVDQRRCGSPHCSWCSWCWQGYAESSRGMLSYPLPGPRCCCAVPNSHRLLCRPSVLAVQSSGARVRAISLSFARFGLRRAESRNGQTRPVLVCSPVWRRSCVQVSSPVVQ